MAQQEIRENVLELMKQKDQIENEIKQLSAILSQNGVGMHDPLVDPEGYPIMSIDVYQVRHARHRIIHLQNDHKVLMKQIENGLQGYYSNQTLNSPHNNMQDVEMTEHRQARKLYEVPFGKITLVTPGSPAESAGLQEDDLIVEFGSVNSDNFRNISDIAGVVRHSENIEINLKIKRGSRFLNLALVPQKWQGKGLLGCNFDALK